MTISSTEFQQNVGYYTSLVEKGEEVQFQIKKPLGSTFKIVKIKDAPKKKKSNIQTIMEKAAKYQFRSGKHGENGLKLQRRVRS